MPDHETLLLIFVALTGVAVLLQAFVLLGILLAMLKALKIDPREDRGAARDDPSDAQ